MLMEQLIRQNRSYRRFYQDHFLAVDNLKYFVNLARLSPSARNAQPLKYYISNDEPVNAKIFECLSWAGYLKDWDGPEEGERPSAYIVVTGDHRVGDNFYCDHGIAAQSILLGAVEKGFGGCIIASVDRQKLREHLQLEQQLEILLVVALGKPKESVMLDNIGKDGDIKYWRDDKRIHHVPKRQLDDIVINFS
ncbi:MAG TPA: nitroreductase family protein [Bacteroidales bacterium]|nr:nitroreductase family protein [Bacteroidales bacterium]